MGQQPTKAKDNVYCQARLARAKYNPKLTSREGAAEMLGISAYSLTDYELGNTVPPCDKVNLMAEMYEAPELRNIYCANECPIGKKSVTQLDVKEMDRSTLELLYSLGKVTKVRDLLLNITADGVIDDNEEFDLQEVLETLDIIAKRTEELKLSIEKSKAK